MQILNNVTLGDDYEPENTLDAPQGTQCIVTIANESAVVQVKYKLASQVEQVWSDEILMTPQTNTFSNVSGFRARNANPGADAQCIAILFEPADPLMSAPTPFTQRLTPGGTILGVSMLIPIVELADFPPANPEEGADIVLHAIPGTAAYWQLKYIAAFAPYPWVVLGAHPVRSVVSGADSVSASGAGWLQFANGPEITVPRPGNYEVTLNCSRMRGTGVANTIMDLGITQPIPGLNLLGDAWASIETAATPITAPGTIIHPNVTLDPITATLRVIGRTNAGAGSNLQIDSRKMALRPIRIG